jgi:hypothetical protein
MNKIASKGAAGAAGGGVFRNVVGWGEEPRMRPRGTNFDSLASEGKTA